MLVCFIIGLVKWRELQLLTSVAWCDLSSNEEESGLVCECAAV